MQQRDPPVANFGAPVGEWPLKFGSHSFVVHCYPTAQIFGRQTAPRVRTGTGVRCGSLRLGAGGGGRATATHAEGGDPAVVMVWLEKAMALGDRKKGGSAECAAPITLL
jgi:hypothetical protein